MVTSHCTAQDRWPVPTVIMAVIGFQLPENICRSNFNVYCAYPADLV